MGMKKLISFSVIVFVLGCAAGPPVKNAHITKSNLPQQHLIENIPTYRQPYMDCGPTSLRMLLNFYGKNLSQEEVGKARSGRVTPISGMEAYVRMQGFGVYSFYDSKKDEVKIFARSRVSSDCIGSDSFKLVQ